MTGNGIGKENAVPLRTAAKRRRKLDRRNRLVAVVVVAVLAFTALFVLYNSVFVVRRFRLEGENDYTEVQANEAAKALNIKTGVPLFGVDRAAAEKLAVYALSAYDSVTLGFDLPDGIVFYVKEAKPVFYLENGGAYYVLSAGLRVLDRVDSATDAETRSLVRISLGNGVTKCVTGEMLACEGGEDELLKTLYAELENLGFQADVSEIDVSNKFDITFLLLRRFTVRLGNERELERKLRFLSSILPELSETESGYLDLTDESLHEGFLKPY